MTTTATATTVTTTSVTLRYKGGNSKCRCQVTTLTGTERRQERHRCWWWFSACPPGESDPRCCRGDLLTSLCSEEPSHHVCRPTTQSRYKSCIQYTTTSLPEPHTKSSKSGLKRGVVSDHWLTYKGQGFRKGGLKKGVVFWSFIIIIIINPLTARVVGAPHMILQPVLSIFFPVFHCPLGLAELQACPFPDVVFPPLPLSALSS